MFFIEVINSEMHNGYVCLTLDKVKCILTSIFTELDAIYGDDADFLSLDLKINDLESFEDIAAIVSQYACEFGDVSFRFNNIEECEAIALMS